MKSIVTMEKMVFGASCIATVDGKTVFIPYSLPGETLEITIVKERENYCEGKIEKILHPSVYRVTPVCPYFYACGGCNMQMAESGYQHELRYSAAAEAFERAVKHNNKKNGNFETDFKISADFIFNTDWEYRSRFQLHITENGFAQKKHNGSELTVIHDCPVAVPAIRTLLKNGMKNFGSVKPMFRIGTRAHIFSSDGKIFTENNHSGCYAVLCGKIFKFNPLGFFQSNLKMTEKLIKTVLSEILPLVTPDGRILDFYSGVGTFSVFLSDMVQEIHLVEHNKYALEYAKENFNLYLSKKVKKPKIFYHAIDGRRWAKTQYASLPFSLVIIDPPRSGIDAPSLRWLCLSGIPLICYISCDPVTFARDAVQLLNSGYTLKKHFILDFYPQTHHTETFAVFQKNMNSSRTVDSGTFPNYN